MAKISQISGGDSQAPPHKGLLREEVLALRKFMGYTDHVECSTTLSVPDKGACLPGSRTKDILLVAIDVDVPQTYRKNKTDRLIHIGVSILDTRHIQQPADNTEEAAPSPDEIIENHQFSIGGSTFPKLAEKASRRFLFGKSEPIDRTEVQARLEKLTAGRDFATVCHGTRLDLEVLDELGVDLPSQGIYLFDTNKVAQWPLQLHYRLSLGKLCAALDIPFAWGHTAGNDSHFALRALLMLAVKDAHRLQQMHGCAISELLLGTIQQIAHVPRPISEEDLEKELIRAQQKAKRKDEKRLIPKKERDDSVLMQKLERKARRNVVKQLRREAEMEGNTNDVFGIDEETFSALAAEKIQEFSEYTRLIRRQKREARLAKEEEERALRCLIQEAELAWERMELDSGPRTNTHPRPQR